MMRDLHVEGDGILVSFDVSYLFTNVPVGEAVCFVIHARLREDETLRDRPSSPQNRLQSYTGVVPEVHLLQPWREHPQIFE